MFKTIVHLHGFASSARSTKAKYLAGRMETVRGAEFYALDMNPTPTDFRYLTTTGAIGRLRQSILDRQPEDVSLVASSFGGLVATYYAHRFGGISKLLLLAPLLSWKLDWLSQEQVARWRQNGTAPIAHYGFGGELPLDFGYYEDGQRYREVAPPAAPTLIIHGRNDDTVPIDYSRAYAEQFSDQVRLIELEADHDLNDHLETIWEQVQAFVLEI
ncbi:MAG: YqiA/YcfP family alpha/beta fold hydrolase [Anaerolineae bacterium]